MKRKLNKRFWVIVALVVINAVGFISAQYYFSFHNNEQSVTSTLIDHVTDGKPKMIKPADFLEFGLDMLRNIGM